MVIRHQLVVFLLELDVQSFSVIHLICAPVLGSFVVVDVSCVKKREHAFHESHSVHIRKDAFQVIGVEVRGTDFLFVSSRNVMSDPSILEEDVGVRVDQRGNIHFGIG